MVSTFVFLTILIMIILTMVALKYERVYMILKLVNNEADIDKIEFNKCILPYNNDNERTNI